MSSRTSSGRLFLVLTAPNREFHPLCARRNHQLLLPYLCSLKTHSNFRGVEKGLVQGSESASSPAFANRVDRKSVV